MAQGIESLLKGAGGEMLREARESDRAAADAARGVPLSEEKDPISTGVSDPRPPGGTGTEYTTSDLEDHEPNDQEQKPPMGPATTPAPPGTETGELTTAPTAAHADAMAILNQQIAAINQQQSSDEEDPAMAAVAWPPTEGNEGEIMPGGGEPLDISDSQLVAGSLLDQLAESPAVSRRMRRRVAKNIGQTGAATHVAAAHYGQPGEGGNPTLDVEKPEGYFGDVSPDDNDNRYPGEYPDFNPPEVGPAPAVNAEPAGPPSTEGVQVRKAIDNILEGHDADAIAARLIGG